MTMSNSILYILLCKHSIHSTEPCLPLTIAFLECELISMHHLQKEPQPRTVLCKVRNISVCKWAFPLPMQLVKPVSNSDVLGSPDSLEFRLGHPPKLCLQINSATSGKPWALMGSWRLCWTPDAQSTLRTWHSITPQMNSGQNTEVPGVPMCLHKAQCVDYPQPGALIWPASCLIKIVSKSTCSYCFDSSTFLWSCERNIIPKKQE